jgi:DNA-binding CsgD family transcriptional regulator/PAS domain-containing protein
MDQLFINAIEAIYDAAPNPSNWPIALQAIADVFFDVGAVLIWQRDDGGFGTIATPSIAEAQRDYHENGWFKRDLPAIRAVERSVWLFKDAVGDHFGISDEEIASHPFYTEFLARHGLRWRGAVGVGPDPHMQVAVSVQRVATKPPFTDDELEILDRLGRHVEKSLRLSIRLFDAELTKVGLGEALARVGIGVFALDSLGRVVFSNPAGNRMLGDGLAIVKERLLVGAAPERAALETAITQMVRAEPQDIAADPKPILIRRQKAARPLAVYVLPITASSHSAAQFLTHARAIVLAIDPEASSPADPALVRDVLGLTLGEARVAALIGAGLSPRESAEKLGITEETARTALKRVFSKTGVSRQSELVALLTKLVLR